MRLWTLLLVLTMAVAAGAQETPETAVGEPTGETIVPVTVPAEHASARATMRTFLEAFYSEPVDLDAAVGCLDLSDLSLAVRSVKGRELAAQLKEVLDRTALVKLKEVPDSPAGPPFVFYRVAEGEVTIAPTETGEWLFTPATVASLDSLHAATSDRDVVEGVEQLAPAAVSPGTWLRSLMPESLRSKAFLLETWQWLGILLVVFGGAAIGRAFAAASTAVLSSYLERRDTDIDREAAVRVGRPVGVLVMLVVWGFGIVLLGLSVRISELYFRGLKVVAIVAAAVTLFRIIDLVSEMFARRAGQTESQYDDMLVPLIRKSLKVFVCVIGLITVAESLGTDLTAVIASLGIGGLALALAAQDTVSNFFGSLMVLLDRPCHVGDWVVVGGVEGTVEEVGFRSTRIRTFHNSLITLPNANLIKSSVDNFGDRDYRRWKTVLSLTYDTPPEKVDAFCEGVRELIRRHPFTRKENFHVYLNEFGAASLNVLVYLFFDTPDWAAELRERHRLAVDILRLAAELGVEFAFPTQTVYLRGEEWSASELAGEAYPEMSDRLTVSARQQARRIVEGTVPGRWPPPGREGGESEA